MVGGILLTALLFELLDAKSGDIKKWVNTKLNDTVLIKRVNGAVQSTITKLLPKSDRIALLTGKVEHILETMKNSFTAEAFEHLKNNLSKEQAADLLEAVRKLEKELGNAETKLDISQTKKLLEGLKDGKSVDTLVAELKKWCENDLRSADDIFAAGKNALDDFDINNAYVKPKHLSTTGGNGQKFIGASKAEAEGVLKDALSNKKVVSITDGGLTKSGNVSYKIIIDAEKTIGTKGEHLIKIVISSDGGMLSAYPIK